MLPNYTLNEIYFKNSEKNSSVCSLFNFPSALGNQAVKLNYLSLKKSPFDLIIVFPTLSAMARNMYFETRTVCLYIESNEV